MTPPGPRGRAVHRLVSLAAIVLAVAVPVVLAGGAPVVSAAAVTVALAAAAADQPWPRRFAATGAPVAAVATLAAGSLQREAALAVPWVLVVAGLISVHLVALDAADSGDIEVIRRCAGPLALGAGTALLVAVGAQLPGLPWLWVPVAGGVAAAVAYRFVIGGLRVRPGGNRSP